MNSKGIFKKSLFTVLVAVLTIEIITVFWMVLQGLRAGRSSLEVLDVVASPDGKSFAYVFMRDLEDTNQSDIYVKSIDGTIKTRLTTEAIFGHSPVWSPDGKRIAFVGRPSHVGENAPSVDYQIKMQAEDIYVVNSDGSDLHNVTHNDIQDYLPVWSPSGKQLAFISGSTIYLMNEDGTDLHLLMDGLSGLVDLLWSSTSDRIVFLSNNTLFLLDVETGDSYPLLQNWDPYCLVCSPTGNRIAFIESSSNSNKSGLYVISVDDGSVQALFLSTQIMSCPAWNPNGTRMVVRVSESLYLVNVIDAQAKPVALVSSPGSEFWDSAGNHIYVVDKTANIQKIVVESE